MQDYWLKQTEKPLFPEILWSRPENKAQAGRLLIVGGSKHGFAAVSHAQQAAVAAGIGEAKAAVPDAIKNILGDQPATEFLASTLSGSFARSGLGTLTSMAAWADAVWLVGDFGKNSETALLLEGLVQEAGLRLALSGDSIDYFYDQGDWLLDRQGTVLLPEFQQLQRLSAGQIPEAFTSSMGLVRFVDVLHKLSAQHEAAIATSFENHTAVAYRGRVVTTVESDVPLAAQVVLWTQFPAKPLEALASSSLS